MRAVAGAAGLDVKCMRRRARVRGNRTVEYFLTRARTRTRTRTRTLTLHRVKARAEILEQATKAARDGKHFERADGELAFLELPARPEGRRYTEEELSDLARYMAGQCC